MDSRGIVRSRMWYYKKIYYGKVKSTVRLSIVAFAMALYLWYN